MNSQKSGGKKKTLEVSGRKELLSNSRPGLRMQPWGWKRTVPLDFLGNSLPVQSVNHSHVTDQGQGQNKDTDHRESQRIISFVPFLKSHGRRKGCASKVWVKKAAPVGPRQGHGKILPRRERQSLQDESEHQGDNGIIALNQIWRAALPWREMSRTPSPCLLP